MRYFCFLVVLCFGVITAIGAGFDYPVVSDDGTVYFSTYTGQGIFRYSDGKIDEIGDHLDRGRDISLADGKIGYKKILENGMQIPIIRDRNHANQLSDPVPSIGVPVIRDGVIYLPQSDRLLIIRENRTRSLPFDNSVQRIATSWTGLIAYVNDISQLRVMETAFGITVTLDVDVFNPVISADGRFIAAEGSSETMRFVKIYTLDNSLFNTSRRPITIPHAESPCWRGAELIFQRTDEYNYKVLSSDLYTFSLATGAVTAITSTESRHEARPAMSPSGRYLAWRDMGSDMVFRAELVNGRTANIVQITPEDLSPEFPPIHRPLDAEDVWAPYLHQVYDTPDDFNGHWSCGPSSCLMAVQKYDRLPDHTVTCSSPYSHTHDFGWYVPNTYTFNGYTYDILGLAAGDVWVPGAHGFICREYGGAVWAYMVNFLDQHMVDSWQTGVAWSTYTGQIDAGYVMCASTSVMGYGHIQCFVGYFGDHGIVANDPYGNANLSPWCQYNGEGVRYDWPGYDNGYLEISISQLFAAQATGGGPVATEPDTLVDDFGYGFIRYGPLEYWHMWYGGYMDNVYWTYSSNGTADENYAYWLPNLPWSGMYQLLVHIPSSYASAQARYKVWHNLSEDITTVDQTAYSDEWVSIGTYGFDDAIGGYVYLGDVTGTSGTYLGCDAIRWHYISPLAPSDSIVDDGQKGFDRTATSRYYHHTYSGWSEHSLYTYTTNSADTCYVIWTPTLSVVGVYEIFAYIPPENADATSARYTVTHNGGESTIVIDQSAHRGSWVSLGTYECPVGTSAHVYLGDATGTASQKIAFDAVKFRLLSETVVEETVPRTIEGFKAWPNPFNSSIQIEGLRGKEISIYDIAGIQVFTSTINNAELITWKPTTDQPSGIYRVVLRNGTETTSHLISYIK